MITPNSLGLPYPTWRKDQLETIEKISKSQKRIMVVEAPWGSGKSALAYGMLKYTGSKGYILTSTKSLQNQYMDSFEPAGLETIYGRSNYYCVLPEEEKKRTTVNNAPCASGWQCPQKINCPYFQQKEKVEKAHVSVFNNSYFLADLHGNVTFKNADWIVADEGHLLDDALCQDVVIPDSDLMVLRLLNTKDLTDVQTQVRQLVPKLEAMRELSRGDPDYARKKANEINSLSNGIKVLSLEKNTIIQYHIDRRETTFSRIWPPNLEQTLLYQGNHKKLLIMSATILDPNVYAKIMGLKDYDYISVDSTFPIENRPIYYRPAGNVVRDNLDKVSNTLARNIDYILEENPDIKGIIHSHSFQLTDLVVSKLRNIGRVLVHTRDQDRTKLIKMFKESSLPVWLISPSIAHGESFDYDLARAQVILKMPFPDMGNQVIRVRMKEMKEYYDYKTMQELWQMCGRVVRSESDVAKSYILDQKFEDLIDKHPNLVPKYIRPAIEF